MGSKIGWTDETWNPTVGCTSVSPGCDHCYARTMHARFHGPGAFDTVVLHPDRLEQPLRWRRRRLVFVDSMSDLFHDAVSDEYIARVFAVMAIANRHTFQILTKRHGRMRSLLSSARFDGLFEEAFWSYATVDPQLHDPELPAPPLPLPNVWLGVSVEDQRWADIRIPALCDTPAAVRFLSCEPLLGPIDLADHLCSVAPCETCDGLGSVPVPGGGTACPACVYDRRMAAGPSLIHWVIAGGESGHGARPMDVEWVRAIRRECGEAGVPLFVKQAGSVLAREWGATGKGEDPDEWPETFPQEYPRTLVVAP